MNRLILAAATCALLAPSVTTAQVILGAQAGASLARGDAEDGIAMDGEVKGAFPLELRAGWRLTPQVTVGLQGGYAFATDGETRDAFCTATGADCSGHLWRVAARGEYRRYGEVWRPYGAATLGWEWQAERWELAGDNWEERSRSGLLAGIEGGFERPLGGRFRGGAFVGLNVGRYGALSVKGENAGYAYSDHGAVDGPTVHVWLGLGLRVSFEL